MLIDKGDLLKVLRTISNFDSPACAYLGVQLPDGNKVQLHRSSADGFIQTTDFDIAGMEQATFASLVNLKDLLNVSSDTMDMIADPNRQLRMVSVDSSPTRLQVFSVRKTAAGFKDHYLGNPSHRRYSGDIFKGFDIRPFKGISQLPTLEKGRLLLSTVAGTVVWTGSEALKDVVTQPREAFLRFIAGEGVKELILTQQGYWMAEKDGLVCAIAGHALPTELLKVHSVPGTELTRFPAVKLLSALSNVSYLTADTDKVELSPKEGVICRDKYSSVQIFPTGATSQNWPRAAIFSRTAKLIVDALSQTSEEEAVLYNIPLRNTTYRIVRGSFEVNFGLL